MKKIIIVDDSTSIHRLVGARIRSMGLEVVACGVDGNEALSLFEKHRPDLVFMDITMPNCDGKNGLKKILELDPKARVVMLSALSAPELVEECQALGAAGFISKDRLREVGYLETQVEALGFGTSNLVKKAA